MGYYPNYLNGTSNLNTTVPCIACPPKCLTCINATFCTACDLTTYLTFGTCIAVCNSSQSFSLGTCYASSSSQYDQSGRLGYDWTYTANQSALNITLTFSQPDVNFYYY